MGKIVMPQMGFDMQEGKLVRWLKKPGDTVQRNEPIAEIETDKATMEIEAFEGGTITRLLVEEGQVVPVGTVIAILDGDEEGASAPAEASPAPAASGTADQAAGGPSSSAAVQVEAAAAVPSAAPVEAPAAQSGLPGIAPGQPGTGRIKASPLARRLAREYGIPLAQITGTGPGGRIVKADVEAARAALARVPAAAAPAASATAWLQGRVEPLSRMRQVIAARMSESKQQAPHFYVSMSIDMGAAMAFRREFNAAVGNGRKASVNDLIVKASGLALTRFPALNASFTPEGIRYHDTVDVAVAVALENGLITPVIRACHIKALDEIAVESRELIELARSGKLRPDQYQGGTFTVSNLGMYGVEDFVAIINPPQAAILAVGAVTDTPVARDGAVVIRPMMRITLSADHRVTDGAEAAQFLREVKAILEQPLRLLMPAPGAKGASGQ